MRPTSRSISQICQQAEALITKNNQPEEALKLLKPLLAKKIRPAKAAKWAGVSYFLLHQVPAALPLLKEALTARPKDFDILMALGDCYLRINQPSIAERWFSQALKINPSNTHISLRLGEAYRGQNKFTDHRKLLSELLQHEPKNVLAWFTLSQYLTFKGLQDKNLAKLHKIENQATQALDDKSQAILYSVLGKAYQDLNQADQAFRYYEKSNELLKTLGSSSKYNLMSNYQTFKAFYKPEQSIRLRNEKGVEASPEIFIVGMSRSGKSLIESLLGCHPNITAGGENNAFVAHVSKTVKQEKSLLNCLTAEPEVKRSTAYSYLNSRDWPEGRITNTLPNNIHMLCFLGVWFPNAPIIFITRNFTDLGLAIYFKHYKEKNTYSLDLYETGREIALTEALMDFWISVLPNPCVKLRYEDLVQKPAQVSKALYQFLDLDWKAEYFSGLQQQRHLTEHLAPHQSIDAPAPIRNDYIGWSKSYEKFLAPLRKGYQDTLAELEATKNP